MPVPIFLDSSCLRGLNPRRKEAEVLRELVKAGAVEVHISTVVEREVISGLADEVRVHVPLGWVSKDEYERLNEAVSVSKEATDHVARGVTSWLNSIGAVRHSPTGEEATRVFDAYFTGAPPFKGKKSRADIPDAFVVENLRTFMSTAAGKGCFVVLDKKLADAARAVPHVEVYDNLLDALTKIDIERPITADEMRDFCLARASELTDAIHGELGDVLVGYELTDSLLPSDNCDGTIASYGDVIDIELEWADAEPVGADVLTIPFHCVVEDCLIDLFVYNHDYLALDEQLLKQFSIADGDWSEHYMWMQTETSVRIEARLLVGLGIAERLGIGKRVLSITDIDFSIADGKLADPEQFVPLHRRRQRPFRG